MSTSRSFIALFLLTGLLSVTLTPSAAQGQAQTAPAQQRPEAHPADVKSPEAVMEALYDAVSDPAGESRDWDRVRSLFFPDARFMRAGRSDGNASLDVMTVEEFIENVADAGTSRFERQEHLEMERFGDVVHAFSTHAVYPSYQAGTAPEKHEPGHLGIDAMQLWYDGERWWIVNLIVHHGREGAPLPEPYKN